MLHSHIPFHLILSLHHSLKAFIFCPPAAIDPTFHDTPFTMVIAGMESVVDFDLDKMYGCKGDSVFQRCIGC